MDLKLLTYLSSFYLWKIFITKHKLVITKVKIYFEFYHFI